MLADGAAHTVTLVPPAGISDTWLMDGSLFVNVDAASAQTGGAVTQDTIAAAPTVNTSVVTRADGNSAWRIKVVRGNMPPPTTATRVSGGNAAMSPRKALA